MTTRVLYIIKYPRPPWGGGKYQLMSFGGKNMKRGREKGGKCKRKRKKEERKRKKGERDEKRGINIVSDRNIDPW
jgi:hypothetical protein